MPLCKAMKVYEEEDRILLLPSDASIKECLVVSRADGAVATVERPPRKAGSFVLAFGVVGIVHLNAGPYLVLITAQKKVGRLLGQEVFQVIGTRTLQVSTGAKLSAQQKADEAQYRAMLDSVLSNPFYYSFDFDITNSMQRQADADLSLPLHQRADPRFFWNKAIVQPLIDANLHDWVLPIMMGYIDISRIQNFDFALISRRNKNRAGTRYVVRGIDERGHVANNIETEQIVIANKNVSALVQTRGSIPVFWNQRVNLKYKPKPGIDRDSSAALPYSKRHFEEQLELYGGQLAINLIDQKGSELELGQHFDEVVKSLSNPRVSYIAWDFHKECKGMKYHKIDDLHALAKPHIEDFGHFYRTKDGEVKRRQQGTVRTNCMDNLDRTNVVQSVFARYALPEMLHEIGVFDDASKPITTHNELETIFKHTWANNADAISKQYSGTGALKTDFTRTGKRTYKGLISDGINSLVRYYVNNFADGFRQDSFDLFLGNYTVNPEVSPFASKPTTKLPHISMGTLVFFLLSLYLASGGFLPVGFIVLVLLWLVGLFASVKMLLSSGRTWTDRPRLLTEAYE
eukprot:TRINITY_DN2953_c0_g1_i1.p1 TRINITY_DN2953_c0_g1~~TRINITY_DN2953_c0_g1_i1.p1  ORF type:complete len:582 (+),score=174.38 TRINITY_DN2953_c0_g1_i1:28-1746(+)